jgi:hypothetical protein
MYIRRQANVFKYFKLIQHVEQTNPATERRMTKREGGNTGSSNIHVCVF